ncbi:MAG: hypothetical protein QM625_09210 [Ralstonia sp.]|jgi:hypothetical protein|uniref:Uncharacterized protein n=2 Tax=Ralstonia TaxID=48736 RepID=A0ABN9J0D8_9RALS|nr:MULTISPECIES: hypothetical protein [Ralstonia]MBA9845248.1 hypothetical protein [Ralstonia pickettii]MBA9852360.1 hypothetical protein [Ralstonia pickettii]MBA9878668.1 hypothetical protein [Ralstonia pickettii]MBA9881901.1 hypothetical protein [Ralstonia pickettii]MBA9888744.1 hypothetical protein [Ralstonia pickettii]
MNVESFDFYGSQVCNARLMEPAEVLDAVRSRNGIPGVFAGWCLCGDTTEPMFDTIATRGEGVDLRLSGFFGSAKGAYATITQQVGGMQHRFLLPLFEPQVIAYLEALERQPIQVMLGRAGQSQALMLHNLLPWRTILPLVGMCQRDRCLSVGEALEEMAEAIHSICRPETIPSIYKGIDLTEVSVSVLAPAMYCAEGEVDLAGEPI